MSPQELIINKSVITWELDDTAGTSTILNGKYIEKGIIEIENKLWVKQGISVFSRVFQINSKIRFSSYTYPLSRPHKLSRSGAMLQRN